MEASELKYRELIFNNAEDARKFDLLLRRCFDPTQYSICKSKKYNMWRFLFWLSDEEFDDICSAFIGSSSKEMCRECETMLHERLR